MTGKGPLEEGSCTAQELIMSTFATIEKAIDHRQLFNAFVFCHTHSSDDSSIRSFIYPLDSKSHPTNAHSSIDITHFFYSFTKEGVLPKPRPMHQNICERRTLPKIVDGKRISVIKSQLPIARATAPYNRRSSERTHEERFLYVPGRNPQWTCRWRT